MPDFHETFRENEKFSHQYFVFAKIFVFANIFTKTNNFRENIVYFFVSTLSAGSVNNIRNLGFI
jgi:hypothetical protein